MSCAAFLGLATIDLLYEVESVPRENEKGIASRQEVLCGGPAANAAITCAFLGAPVRFIGAVGKHPLTSVIRSELQRFGVSLYDLSSQIEESPPLSSVFVNARTASRTIMSGHATRHQILTAGLDPSFLSDAELLLVDGHQMALAITTAEQARAKGIPVVLDGGSWKERTDELLVHTQIAICSEDFHPPGTSTSHEAIHYLLEHGVAAAVTRGAQPILWAEGSRRGEIPVPVCNAVDTTGAGDILHGAFCRRHLGGAGFVESLTFAASVASYSCRFFGTRAWMESWSDH